MDFYIMDDLKAQIELLCYTNKYDEALDLFDSLLDIPNHLLQSYAALLLIKGDPQSSLNVLDTVDLEVEGVSPDQIMFDKAMSLSYLGRMEEARSLLESCNADEVRIKFGLGRHYLREGEFKKGFEYLQAGVESGYWSTESVYLKAGRLDSSKKWDGKTKTRTLALFLEGHVGDQIAFFRFARNISAFCERLVVYTDDELVGVIADSLEIADLPNIQSFDVIPHQWMLPDSFDSYVFSLQTPFILNLPNPTSTMPYIRTFGDGNIFSQIRNLRHQTNRPIIALNVKESTENGYMPTPIQPDYLIDTCNKRGTVLNLGFADNNHDDDLIQTRDMVKDWKDASNLIKNCDVIVTACPETAHLSAAMGKETIVLTTIFESFVWNSGPKIKNWYGNHVHVISQTDPDNWDSVFRRVSETLDILGYTEHK